MLVRVCSLVLFVAFATQTLSSPLSAQTQPQKGAVAGGIAGAIIGGIAGHQNDETPEGIAIGGAVGAIAGGLFGKAQENQMVRDYEVQQYQYQQRQRTAQVQRQQYAQQVNRAVSIGDVVSMAQSGVGDSVIMNQIRTNGVRERIGVPEIISMHQQGVSELVITEMQKSPLAGTTSRTTQRAVVTHQPVIVERHRPTVIVEPTPVYIGQRTRYQSPSHNSGYRRSHDYHR